MNIVNPPVAQQRKDRLRLAQQRKAARLERAYRFLTPRNSDKGDRIDVRA